MNKQIINGKMQEWRHSKLINFYPAGIEKFEISLKLANPYKPFKISENTVAYI